MPHLGGGYDFRSRRPRLMVASNPAMRSTAPLGCMPFELPALAAALLARSRHNRLRRQAAMLVDFLIRRARAKCVQTDKRALNPQILIPALANAGLSRHTRLHARRQHVIPV